MQNLVAISDFDKIKFLAERFNVPLRKINHIDEAENFKNQLNILSLDYPEDFSPGEFEVKNAASVRSNTNWHRTMLEKES